MLSGSAKMGGIELFVGDSLYLGKLHKVLPYWAGTKTFTSSAFSSGSYLQLYILVSADHSTSTLLSDCMNRGYNFMSTTQPNSTWVEYKCGSTFSSGTGTVYGPHIDLDYLTYNNDNQKVQCTVSSGVYPYTTTCSTTTNLASDYLLSFKATKTVLVSSHTDKKGESSDSIFCAGGTSCSLSYGVTKEFSTTVDLGYSASISVDALFWSGEVTLSVNTAFSSTQSIAQSSTIDVTPTVSMCYDVIDSLWTITNTYMTQLAAMGSIRHSNGYDISLSNLFVQSPSIAVVTTMTTVKNVRGLGVGYECDV
jgi:hypothetical protein